LQMQKRFSFSKKKSKCGSSLCARPIPLCVRQDRKLLPGSAVCYCLAICFSFTHSTFISSTSKEGPALAAEC
jgi:hypothetical protein